MKCISCNTEIDPKWKHAITKNSCPFCGKDILDDKLKKLFSTAESVLTELSNNYPSELEDWMRSNFLFVKPNKIAQHHLNSNVKSAAKSNANIKTEIIDGEEVQVEGEVLNDSSVNDAFMQNAGAGNIVKERERLRKLAKEIREKGARMVEFTTEGDDTVSEEDMEPIATSDLVEGMSAALSQSLSNPEHDNLPSFLPSTTVNNASRSDRADMARLQRLMNKTENARNEMANGGGVGKIRRA